MVPRVLADTAHRGGSQGKVVERRVRELRRRQHRPVKLGRERTGRRDGNRLEPLAADVERPDERDLGARDRLRGLRQSLQRLGRARRPRRGRNRAYERRERWGSEAESPVESPKSSRPVTIGKYSGRSARQSTKRGDRLSQTVPPHIGQGGSTRRMTAP